jgi:hypothetical protein
MERINKYILIYGIPPEDFYREVKDKHILIPEMRPYLLGAKILAKELEKRKIKSTLISDNGLGHLFFLKAIDKVYLFGFDDNTFPVGAQAVKILAQRHAVALEIQKGKDVKLDKFPDQNAKTFLGIKTCVNKTKVITPQNESLN